MNYEHMTSHITYTCQLLLYYPLLDIAGDELRFGDEIECGVFVVDNIKKTVKLSVRSREVCNQLQQHLSILNILS